MSLFVMYDARRDSNIIIPTYNMKLGLSSSSLGLPQVVTGLDSVSSMLKEKYMYHEKPSCML